ncbi:AAA family ATPase [Henriciella litoralis]|uniref:AAA family ATPase n=1 Tax=Henriciella litoralis TaxID=568102 RepID=UPI000A03E588|nr:AAA family ATPase [Henriciella litoralis]
MTSPMIKKGLTRLHSFAPRWQDNVSEAASTLQTVAVTHHRDVNQLLDAASNEVGSVVLVEYTGDFDLVKFMIRVSEVAPSLPGIVIGENIPVLAVKRLLTMSRWDMLDAPINAAQLGDTLETICRDQTSKSDATSGKCWTVTSSVGGAGATLVAVEMAYQLSQREQDNKVCLVDLDFFDGACASYLNCPSNLNQSALTQSADRIDEALLQAFITQHKNGIHLLSAPRSKRLWNSIKTEAILKVLDIACANYDFVIIDLPRWPSPWAPSVVTGSDENIVMSELTVPALHAARNRAEELEDLSEGIARPRIVLNRMTKKVFGNTVTVSQAEEAIGRPVFATITSEWDAAVSAVNFGQAVGQAKPGNRISKDISMIIETLEAGGSVVSENPKTRKRA